MEHGSGPGACARLRCSSTWSGSGAQLGQLTKLVSGNDKGWRGEVLIDAILSGTPAAMQVASICRLQDFHRYDIADQRGIAAGGALRR